MANIADIIEEYIKALLNRSYGGMVVLRRSELAEKFRCVPSQINYVLSTRFTNSNGYIIETRRGGGGFVRVIRVSLDEAGDLLDIVYDKVGSRISLREAKNLIRYLEEEDLVTKREALLMANVVELATPESYDNHEAQRAVLLKSMLMVLFRHGK